MKVYVITANDFPDCVLAYEDAAEEFVAYKNDLEIRNKGRRTEPRVYWRAYPFDLIYGQHR